jgi:uncharacterized FAD-dependent dehydrogenase
LGVRAEHPQSLIDSTITAVIIAGRFATCTLYIVKQVGGRGMYSFACVREVLLPHAQPIREMKANGWSPSKGSGYRQFGIVVELKLEDFKPFAKYGALAGIKKV